MQHIGQQTGRSPGTPRGSRRCRLAWFWLAVSLLALGSPTLAFEKKSVRLNASSTAVLSEDGSMLLQAAPLRGEGLERFTARLCGDRARASMIRDLNRIRGGLKRDRRYDVPFDCLVQPLRQQVLQGLFPGDRAGTTGWIHRVPRSASPSQLSLWKISEWFTGSGENYTQIRRFNQLADETLTPGQEIIIPTTLLPSGFRTLVLVQGADASALEYGSDAMGRYARYRLQTGEALYSSVVVRFTGEVYASEVNRLAKVIADRSGIADVTDIPVGYEVKVPLDLLAPEFLPSDDPRRLEWEEGRRAAAQYSNQTRSLDLAGVKVILDAGHGGVDIGAAPGGTWESVYVYDIMLRVRETLLSRTAATVLSTTRDGPTYEIADRDVLAQSKGHAVLTTPPYPIAQANISAHMRWYLANEVYSQAKRQGTPSDKVVFLSIHADSLHPSLRGAMAYLPGLLGSVNGFGKTGSVYSSRKEVRSQPRVSFSYKERVRSEGLSRDLAENIMEGFRAHGLAIHKNKPVRDRIIRRRGRAWVPAVLKYNAVPAKVLIEVCNLGNADDRRLIRTRAYRQKAAEAIVDGLLAYYGQGGSAAGSVQTAGGGR